MTFINNLKSNSIINLLKSMLLTILKFLDKYYFIFIGLYFLKGAMHTALHAKTGIDYKVYLFLLVLAAFTAYKDIRNDVKIIPFLMLAIPYLLLIWYISKNGYDFWGKMLKWQISQGFVVNWNNLFSKIPFNDASFARIIKNDTLTWFFRLVYNNGFVLPVMIPLYRAAISKDFKKMLRYTLSAHIFQVFLITPFYLIFHVQEVWYVLGQPDGLARHLTPKAAAGVTLNCFPSMHTSIAFAMFLLVLREKDKIFKFIWAFFCLCVVYSTMYLEIHWVIDVIGGIILAIVTVKLVDFVLDKGEKLLYKPLSRFYYRDSTRGSKSTTINNYYLDTL
ncbi:phosphatase PAP2 family protein [Clostridium sp. JN-9]|uniref:phosphatase PAP2 family protein n=1 Tax=Clostridium sp. JN-9 TaxID=2507159 RepID=UPI000FFE16FD|nr:phosphatase PAP2 family protein [Clostridium sp. JN-9]QAT39267.1 inositol phosphorylceramide synthase [Clostridium sp. JN-9]